MTALEFLVPAEIGAGVAAGLFGVSFLSSFVSAAFGLGGGMLLLTVMASLVPPLVLIPVHGVVQLGSNLGRAVLMIRSIRWRHMTGFLVGSLAGVTLGGSIATSLPPGLVLTGIGLFILWSVLAQPPAWLGRWPALTGVVSSFLTMFFGATGPFVAVYLKGLGLDRHARVATHAALMTAQHLLKSLAFGFLGFAFGNWIGFAAAMILCGLIGTFFGKMVLTRIGETWFRRALDTLLVIAAVRLIWIGLLSG